MFNNRQRKCFFFYNFFHLKKKSRSVSPRRRKRRVTLLLAVVNAFDKRRKINKKTNKRYKVFYIWRTQKTKYQIYNFVDPGVRNYEIKLFIVFLLEFLCFPKYEWKRVIFGSTKNSIRILKADIAFILTCQKNV